MTGLCLVFAAGASAWTWNEDPLVPTTGQWKASPRDYFNHGAGTRTLTNFLQDDNFCAREAATGCPHPQWWGIQQKVYFNGVHPGCMFIEKISWAYYTWGLGGSDGVGGGVVDIFTNKGEIGNTADFGDFFAPTGSNRVEGQWDYAGTFTESPEKWYCDPSEKVVGISKKTYDVPATGAGLPDAAENIVEFYLP